jgi:hypothetical protein
VAKENDDDADRDPESNGEVHERWEEKGEISQSVTEARKKLPDDERERQPDNGHLDVPRGIRVVSNDAEER